MDREMVQATAVMLRRMEPDMVRPRIDKIFVMITCSRMTLFILLLLLCVGLSLLNSRLSHAEEKNVVLTESGIHYPGGFDANTVGVVQGRVYELIQPASGPVQFRLDTGRENYTVIASPPWYWRDLSVKIPDGTEVKVRGSKSLGKDGKLYIVGQEMEMLSTGEIYSFRDDHGNPLWKGGRPGAKGPGGGLRSFQNRFGGGISGMNKGRK